MWNAVRSGLFGNDTWPSQGMVVDPYETLPDMRPPAPAAVTRRVIGDLIRFDLVCVAKVIFGQIAFSVAFAALQDSSTSLLTAHANPEQLHVLDAFYQLCEYAAGYFIAHVLPLIWNVGKLLKYYVTRHLDEIDYWYLNDAYAASALAES